MAEPSRSLWLVDGYNMLRVSLSTTGASGEADPRSPDRHTPDQRDRQAAEEHRDEQVDSRVDEHRIGQGAPAGQAAQIRQIGQLEARPKSHHWGSTIGIRFDKRGLGGSHARSSRFAGRFLPS